MAKALFIIPMIKLLTRETGGMTNCMVMALSITNKSQNYMGLSSIRIGVLWNNTGPNTRGSSAWTTRRVKVSGTFQMGRSSRVTSKKIW